MRPIERHEGFVEDRCPNCAEFMDEIEGKERLRFICSKYLVTSSSGGPVRDTSPCYQENWKECEFNKPEPVLCIYNRIIGEGTSQCQHPATWGYTRAGNCTVEMWGRCDHNKPEPVKEYEWVITLMNGLQARVTGYYTQDEMEAKTEMMLSVNSFRANVESERVRQ